MTKMKSLHKQMHVLFNNNDNKKVRLVRPRNIGKSVPVGALTKDLFIGFNNVLGRNSSSGAPRIKAYVIN